MAELTKPNLVKNPKRAKLLLDKIKDKSKFTLFDGEAEVFLEFVDGMKSTAAMAFVSKRYADIPAGKIFVVIDGKQKTKFPTLLALSGIKKTKEFGSSKGSGGGADATASTETMQCYYAAYLLNNNDLSLLDPNKSYAEELTKFFASRPGLVEGYDKNKQLSFQDCWDFWVVNLKEDAEWMDTFIATANKIKINATNFTKRPVYFHRGSPFMDSIYARKKKCEKHNKDLIKSGTPPSELKESIASFSDDKWNPGDIWMSTQKPTEEPFTWTMPDMPKNMEKHICDWPSLQKAVFQSALWGETLGISLKKTGASATLKEFNNIGDVKERIKYKGFRFGDGDFFNSVDMYIEFNNGSIQYRPTDGDSSWQGEIKGTKASGGKAGGGPTNYFAELYFGRSIDSNSKLPSGTWSEKKGKITPEDKKKMYELYKKYNKLQTIKKKTAVKIKIAEVKKKENLLEKLSKDFTRGEDKKFYTYTSTVDTVSEKDFIILGDTYTSRGKNASNSFYFGKYMALAFIDLISSRQGGVVSAQDGFATDIVRYAQSNIDNVSTYFWKIS